MNVLKSIHPIFLLALGLHAAFLMIPLSGSSDQVIPPPDPEGETISVTRITPEAEATKPATVKQPATSTATPAVVVARPAPTQPAKTARQPATTTRPAVQGNRATDRADSANPGRENRAAADRRSDDDELPNLDSNPATPSSGERPVVNTPSPAAVTQAPLTLAALAEKAKGDVTDALKARLAWFAQLYGYRVEQTTDETEAAALTAWLGSLRDRTGITDLTPQALEKTIQVPYPLEREDSLRYQTDFVACLKEAPKPALIGIAFDQAGAIAADPVILRGTGYEFLNQEALERAKQYDGFPPEKAQQAYTIDIKIDQDSERCPLLPVAEIAEGE